ncbi:MAG: hypothetical protein HC858_00575 [Brachymonas sp.]|nr:hypothetical protein [Brachymonas sp.]
MGFLDWFKSNPQAAPSVDAQGMQRWVVLDVETSGLDPSEAQLLAVAAVAVQVDWAKRKLWVCPGDSIDIGIRPATIVSDKSNILIHGIGQQRQQSGRELGDAFGAGDAIHRQFASAGFPRMVRQDHDRPPSGHRRPSAAGQPVDRH